MLTMGLQAVWGRYRSMHQLQDYEKLGPRSLLLPNLWAIV